MAVYIQELIDHTNTTHNSSKVMKNKTFYKKKRAIHSSDVVVSDRLKILNMNVTPCAVQELYVFLGGPQK